MFTAYLLYRMRYYPGFVAASRELDLVLGGINTVVLIGSSLTVALGVHAAQTGKKQQTVNYLIARACWAWRFWSSSPSSTPRSSTCTPLITARR